MTPYTNPARDEAVNLERVAKSLTDMLIEYVDGGINSNQNWRNGLSDIVLARLRRLMPAPTPASGADAGGDADRQHGMNAAIRLARYQLRRGADDLGVGEVDTLLRMVVACGEDSYIPLAEEGSEAAEREGSPLQRAVLIAAQRLSLRRGVYWPAVDPEQQKVYLAEVMSVVASLDEERGGPGHHYGLGYAQGQADLALAKPSSPAVVREPMETQGPYEAWFCKDTPADCCDEPMPLTAPAPASGVDAVAVKPLEWLPDVLCHGQFLADAGGGYQLEPRDGSYAVIGGKIYELFDTLDEAKSAAQADYEQRIRSVLSPAATSGSEAGGDWRSVLTGMVEAMNRYGHEIGDGDIPSAHRNLISRAEQLLSETTSSVAEGVRALAIVRMFKERIERHGNWDEGCFYYGNTSASELQEPLRLATAALAKPAYSPAGGDVAESHALKALMRAVRRAEDGAGTLPAKEAVKLRPADWHAVCDRARDLAALAPAAQAGAVAQEGRG